MSHGTCHPYIPFHVMNVSRGVLVFAMVSNLLSLYGGHFTNFSFSFDESGTFRHLLLMHLLLSSFYQPQKCLMFPLIFLFQLNYT